jgi:hypothetical protein
VRERGWEYRRRRPEGPVLFLVAFSCKGRGVCPSCNAKRAHGTAVPFIQFFGSALQVTPHFHSLVPDDVFVPREGGVRFEALPPPTQSEQGRSSTRPPFRLCSRAQAQETGAPSNRSVL